MKISRVIWWILTLGCAAVILGLSLQSVKQSVQLSGKVTDTIIERDESYQQLSEARKVIKNNQMHDRLRKEAHILTFAALGFCATMLVRTYTKRWMFPIVAPAGMAFAVLDETVQLLRHAGRTFEWSDIYRDWQGVFAGACLAAVVALVLYGIQRIKRGE